MTTLGVMAVGVLMTYTPFRHVLGFVQMPALYWPLLVLTVLCYALTTQSIKMLLVRKGWV